MMTGDIRAVAAIAIMAGVTLLLRVLPFLLFQEGKAPAWVEFLGKYLPHAIMGMLVVYCLKDISLLLAPFGLPELAAAGLVAILHIWKRNTLLSIAVGTAFYMILLRLIG